ncbi:response regulator transcription factor [uncultured Polaribacter sp.]|uniref:response regulator transcription factor n=1 Tax=uncultured Polaribacter sp. TaxID=174711 RepID=UPI00261DE7DD|nr:response regulator transcription factor [uncultured Polaribacter sp.]
MNHQIHIAIIDDEQLFREGIRFILEKQENFNVVFEANNGQKLLDFIDSTDQLPDVILMDLKMPVLDGIEATKMIHRKHKDIKIIALTSYNNKSFITSMIDFGASSYLLKNTSPKVVVKTINQVFKYGYYYDDHVMDIINENAHSSSGKKIKAQLNNNHLSRREKDVLELLCEQLTTSEIAGRLFISPRTVEGHRNSLLLKTASKNVAGLVIYGIQKRLIEVSPDFD